jgi:hypothetical protein
VLLGVPLGGANEWRSAVQLGADLGDMTVAVIAVSLRTLVPRQEIGRAVPGRLLVRCGLLAIGLVRRAHRLESIMPRARPAETPPRRFARRRSLGTGR